MEMEAADSGKRMSVDAKVLYGAAGFCSILGLILLIVGAIVYTQNAQDGEDVCLCPDDGSEGECCEESFSTCPECWCGHSGGLEGYCSGYERTGSHGGAGLGLALAGLAVCVLSSAMLITVQRCKHWAQKNLHVRYPAVSPADS